MNFHLLRPGANCLTHLLISAIVWSSVGLMLLGKGIVRSPHLDVTAALVFFAGILLGTCKSLLCLDRAAKRTISRIHGFSEKTWLPAVYSLKTWLLIVVMMLLGLVLKYSGCPTIVLSFIYYTVGWGLLFSSRNMWRAFWKLKQGKGEW